MKVLVIGGTGQIGTYLVPRLVMAGYEVVTISRKQKIPHSSHFSWSNVNQILLDRTDEEEKNNFGKEILKLAPDIVIDLICFKPESAMSLVETLQGKVLHFLSCGTIWVHGPSEIVPTNETQPRKPFGKYGIDKAAIESFLLRISHQTGFPATVLHPGHIVGKARIPLNPAGNFNPEIFKRLAEGKEILLPNLGMETVHHVHADDVAQSFIKAITHRNLALGESFHIVSEQAMTLYGYAIAMADWFGKSAKIKFLPWEEWKNTVSENEALATWDHIAHSPNCSIEKAKRLLNYSPGYTSLEAIQESLQFLDYK